MLASEIINSSQTNLAFHARIRKMPNTMRQAISDTPAENSSTGASESPQSLEKIETRFGIIEVNPKNPVIFEHGLLGVPNSRHFVLADFPNGKLAQFKLLQSLDEKELSFITLPLVLENPIIERSDLEKASADIGIPAEQMVILLIVSVHRTPQEVKLSVNARAPLLIDGESRFAMQYVFQHSRYKVQQFLENTSSEQPVSGN